MIGKKCAHDENLSTLDILFRQITTFIKVYVPSKIYQLKGLKPKNKGHTNFYEKVYLMYVHLH